MTRTRFWQIWSNLHVVDDDKVSPSDTGLTRKFQPVLDVLSSSNYSPGQELSVDEAMVKYKGRARGKVCMPKKKPIKKGFKIISYGAAAVRAVSVHISSLSRKAH